MPWTPNANEPSAVFEEPIINNTLAIIERDFKNALDYFYASDRLPDFKERALGQIRDLAFPTLAITPRVNDTEEAADRSHIVEACTLDIYLGVKGSSANEVTRLIMKYVRVMDAILRTARADFFTDMSNPFGVVLQIRHSYGPVGSKETQYFRAAIVELTVNLRER